MRPSSHPFGPIRERPTIYPITTNTIAEAVLATGTLCAAARDLSLLSPAEVALGVVAMAGHDIGHDGNSACGGVLEALAAAETVRISRTAGVDADQSAWLAYIIEGTDLGAVADNEARSAGACHPAGSALPPMRSVRLPTRPM